MVKETDITKAQTDSQIEENDDDIIVLVDEEGKEVEFYHAATLDYKGEWYILLAPAEEVEGVNEDELVIFKLGQDPESGEDLFLPVEDENLEKEVYDEYVKMVEESDGCDCGHDHVHEHKHGEACGCGEHEHEHKHECDCGDECCKGKKA